MLFRLIIIHYGDKRVNNGLSRATVLDPIGIAQVIFLIGSVPCVVTY